MVTMTMKITGPLFLHDTLVYADVTPYQIWLHKVQHLEKQLKFLTSAVQNSNLTFSLDTLTYIMISITLSLVTKESLVQKI